MDDIKKHGHLQGTSKRSTKNLIFHNLSFCLTCITVEIAK